MDPNRKQTEEKIKADIGAENRQGRPFLRDTRARDTTRDVAIGNQRTLDSLLGTKSKKK